MRKKQTNLGSKLLDQRGRQHKYMTEKLRQKPEFKKTKKNKNKEKTVQKH